jgi:hypothetical protein
MSGIHLARVRATISVAEVLNPIGFVPCEACGDQVRAPCPLHRAAGSPQIANVIATFAVTVGGPEISWISTPF